VYTLQASTSDGENVLELAVAETEKELMALVAGLIRLQEETVPMLEGYEFYISEKTEMPHLAYAGDDGWISI